MTTRLLGFVLPLLFGVILLNVFLFFQQASMIFFPIRELQQTPADWKLDYEDVWINSGDGVRLHGWYIPRQGARQTVLFFHGNAGNISHRRESIEIFHRLNLNVFILSYRGYGASEGMPDEKGLYNDARSAWRYLTVDRKIEQEDIILFGRSLGGAVATALATEVQPAGLILESTFSSAKDMAAVLYPVLHWVIYTRYVFDTATRLRQVHSPLLVIHSADDEIIPFRLGQKVFKAANEPKQLIEIRGDHNGGFLLSQPQYEHALSAFIASLGLSASLQNAGELGR